MTETNSDTEVIIIPDRRAANPYRKPFLVLVVAICLSLIAESVSSWLTWDVANNTNKLVSDVDFRNSPENRAEENRALEEIILRVDCNSRKAIEEALNEIALETPSISFDINITTERCTNTDVADPDE